MFCGGVQDFADGGTGKFIWKELSSWTMIGRWMELMVVWECHSESIAMWEEGIVRTEEVGFTREGSG